MVRLTFKWNFVLFYYLCQTMAINSLPITNVLNKSEADLSIIESSSSSEDSTNVAIKQTADDEVVSFQEPTKSVHSIDEENVIPGELEETTSSRDSSLLNSAVRPGQEITKYVVTFTRDDNIIKGRAVLTIDVTSESRLEPIRLHSDGLTIQSIRVGIYSDINAEDANFHNFDGVLTIIPRQQGTAYVVVIEYTVPLRNDGRGIFVSQFNDIDYIAMNLHPINARRVFPCVDEPNILSTVVFSFKDLEHNHIAANSQLDDGDDNESLFMPLQGPLHTWGMVSHNLINVNSPVGNVLLYVRPGITGQDHQAVATMNFVFTNLNEWTGKQYFEIILNQNEQMHIFALPDTNRDWYALSTVCIWEPYVLMELAHSVRQRTTAITAIAEAISRQWFGYAIYPENFRFQWVITGLGKYAVFEILKAFQTDPLGNDVSLVDMKTIFTMEVIQEGLLRDSYSGSRPMQPNENIFSEHEIRDAVNGLVKYKAPAIMHMFRNVLGDEEQNFIQTAVKAIFSRIPLQWINSINFYDAINSKWLFEGNQIVPEVAMFAQPWVELRGYPLVHVGLRQGGLLLTQEHFAFTPAPRGNFLIPITYTTGAIGNFENIHPVMMLDVTTTLSVALDDDDFVLFNIQGQGYYRVNYDIGLWERIIDALYDEEIRETIHPLNRATLIDDSLILARAAKLDYDIAFQVVLAMELETDYAPWKAFVRNMDFLRKHLLVYVEEDEELDPDIYLRMVRRTIGTFEEEIGFEPEPNLNVPAMISLTRGLVMDHACRANYDPCIAAAVDWFYDPNDDEVVNPNIPHEIRPAVYCTMVREGDEEVIEALMDRLEIELTQYERLVIWESMACSEDEDFIQELLLKTIDDESPFGAEERVKIFSAIVNSNFENTNAALAFLTRNTATIRQKYGGADKLEDLLFLLADNIVEPVQLEQFVNWINSVNSNLEDSLDVAMRARDQAIEIMEWRDAHLEDIYEWIDENDAPTMIVSSILIFLSLCVAIFNN